MNQDEQKKYDEIIERIRINLSDRFMDTIDYINQFVEEYSKALGFSQVEILSAIEGARSYCASNYYQPNNFPLAAEFEIFETQREFANRFPSKIFLCPHCDGFSTNPYQCNSQKEMGNKFCDWKAHGFFRTLGRGYRFTIKQTFLDNPIIDEIFMPIERISQNTEAQDAE